MSFMSRVKQSEGDFIQDPFQNAAAIVLNIAKDVSKKKFSSRNIRGSRESLKIPETQSVVPVAPRFSLPVGNLSIMQETGSLSSETAIHKKDCQDSQDSGVSSPVKGFSKFEDERMAAKMKASSDLIQTLYKLHIKREENLEEECEAFRKALQEQASGLIGRDILEKRIKTIKDISQHLQKIMEESAQLKQKLLNPVCHDAWNVHVSHHRDIVEFFDSAHSMLTKIQTDSESIKWNGRRNVKDNLNLESYLSEADRTVMELHKNLESLTEFRIGLKNFQQTRLETRNASTA